MKFKVKILIVTNFPNFSAELIGILGCIFVKFVKAFGTVTISYRGKGEWGLDVFCEGEISGYNEKYSVLFSGKVSPV